MDFCVISDFLAVYGLFTLQSFSKRFGFRQMKQFPLTFSFITMVGKTQQRSSVFGICFDVSNTIISHNEYILRFTVVYRMIVIIYVTAYTMSLYKFKYT